MKYELLGYMHIYLIMKQFFNKKLRKIHETSMLWKRKGHQGRRYKNWLRRVPDKWSKANLLSILVNALEKKNGWRYPLIWLLGSWQPYCMLHGMEAKSQGRERRTRGKSSMESRVSRWKKLRELQRDDSSLLFPLQSTKNLFQVFKYVSQVQWSHSK